MGDRCAGDCCRRFSLPFSPRELRRRADKLVDGEQVRDMVIYLGRQRPGKMHIDWPEKHAKDKRHYYTCKNLSADGTSCTIYETRPQVCRSFPNGTQCPYKGCTWDLVNGPDAPKEEVYNPRSLRIVNSPQSDPEA